MPLCTQNLLTPHVLKPVKSVKGQEISLCLMKGPEKLWSHWNREGQMTGRQSFNLPHPPSQW